MKDKMINSKIVSITMLFVTTLIIVLSGCKQEVIISRTSENPLIAGYLKLHANDYSIFVRILDTTNYTGFLSAYGTYTCFAPTNDAFNNFLTQHGKSSLKDLSMEDMQNIVKFHVMRDTFNSKQFTDGKLPNPNMYGQYLTTGTILVSGQSKIIINKVAIVLEKDIRLENGIMFKIDHVMEPALKTVGQIIEANPDYSIFVQALKETGYFDTINPAAYDTSKHIYYTVLGESNTVLQNAGFTTYDQLKARYSNLGDPTNPIDSLNLYVRYHILKGLYFVADMFKQATLTTLVSSDVITTKIVGGDSMLINDDIINGVHFKGVMVVRAISDFAAINGVFNTVDGHFKVRIQAPTPVYWDLAAQPEAIANIAKYRQTSQYIRYQDIGVRSANGLTFTMKNMSFGVGNTSAGGSAVMGFYCGYQTAPFIVEPSINLPMPKGIITNDDCFYISLRGTNNKAYCQWVQFTTPVIIKGKYKVWVCTPRHIDDRVARQHFLKVTIDGTELSDIISTSQIFDVGTSDDAMEQLGYKRYLWNAVDTADVVYTTDSPKRHGYGYLGRKVGTIEFTTTQTHQLRIDPALSTGNPSNVDRIDMIQFIPVNMDQVWPKFDNQGNQVQKPQ